MKSKKGKVAYSHSGTQSAPIIIFCIVDSLLCCKSSIYRVDNYFGTVEFV